MLRKVINIDLLGHPLNWIVVIGAIVLFWFGAYTVAASYGVIPKTSKDSE